MAVRVSVVVATHNRAERLGLLLASLSKQTLAPEAFEVIAVDDGSSDETAEMLARARVDSPITLRAIHHVESAGPAVRRDEGWRAAWAPLVAFTDDDCEASRLARGPGRGGRRGPDAILQGRTDPIPTR